MRKIDLIEKIAEEAKISTEAASLAIDVIIRETGINIITTDISVANVLFSYRVRRRKSTKFLTENTRKRKSRTSSSKKISAQAKGPTGGGGPGRKG